MPNNVEEELPSTSDIPKVADIELQNIMENVARSMGDLIEQFSDSPGESLEHPLWGLLGLDKELRSISGLLKVDKAKKGLVGRMYQVEKV